MNDEKTLWSVIETDSVFENAFADLLQEEIDKEILLKLRIAAALPYTVNLSYETPILTVSNWCKDQFGKEWHSYNPDGIWGFINHHSISKGITWYFKNEKDAVLFALRW